MTFCGIRYAHLVVIESALYLYETLLDNDAVARPKGDVHTVKLGVACDADQSASATPGWA